MFEYHTSGTCSKKISFSIQDNRLRDVRFVQGCDGNLKALSVLVEGAPADEIARKLRGIRCGTKDTSCADQLAKAIAQALQGRSA